MPNNYLSILLVEASEAERELIKDIFESFNAGKYSLATAARLSEAVDLLGKETIDIIILDLGLPDSCGLNTLLEMMKVAPMIPVIVLTGNDDEETGRMAIRFGAQDFLVKGNGAEMMLPRICLYTLERYSLQKKARESEMFLRTTIDSLKAHIAIIDQQGVILLVNRSWREFGRRAGADEAKINKGNNYFHVCEKSERDGDVLAQEFLNGTRLVISRELPYFEMEYPCHSPLEQRWYQVKVSPFTGGYEGCLVVAHENITARKKIEEALKLNEECLRLIFDASPNCVYVKDRQGKFIMANNAIARQYGCAIDGLIGRTEPELLAELQLVKRQSGDVHISDEFVLQGNKTFYIEEELVDGEGGRHWFQTIKTPVTFPGQSTCILGISINVTADRLNEEKIRNSELLLRTILDAMHHNIILLDKDMKVIWANKAAQEFEHDVNGDIIGLSCCDVWKMDHVCGYCPARQALETGRMYTESFQVRKKITLRITGCPVFNDKGEIVSVLSIAENVSAKASLEQQLRQAQKMEALGALAGGIAHDFNNILTAILGFTELGLDKVGNNQNLQADLKEVYQASIRARDLVQQILTFSRQIDQELKPLDIALIIKEALKLLRATIPSSILLKSNIPVNLGMVMADPTHIHQIIMNLCTNATHAMGNTEGVLAVNLELKKDLQPELYYRPDLQSGDYLVLKVSDTGCGMSKETLGSIFEPYFTTKEQGEGTGLGLSVVHGIVREYGGDIAVFSELGKGTEFTIILPIHKQGAGVQPDAKGTEMVNFGMGEKIMVVDDEPTILRLCYKMLSKNGYNVEIFDDPLAAITFLQQHPGGADLLLTDMTMPKLTGDKLALEIRNLANTIPILIMSGNLKALPETCADMDHIEMISKPIDRIALLGKIRELLS